MDDRPKELAIVKLDDGLYHFIGAIYSEELNELNKKGFSRYALAVTTREEYGYKEFNPNK